jgi:competence protein ComEA
MVVMVGRQSPFDNRRNWFSKAVILDWLLVSLGLFLIFLVFAQSQGWLNKEPVVSWATFETVMEEEGRAVLVDVAGAVNKPGVYQLPAGSRVNDLVVACEGFSAWASRDFLEKSLNRARFLEDGEKIFIPYQDQEDEGNFSKLADNVNSLVNINLANHQELMSLPGIGEKYAQAIIDYRRKERSFSSIEQIKEVKGIGDKVFENIKSRLEI